MRTETGHYPSFEEIEAFLKVLSPAEPERVRVAIEGRSRQDRPVYSITLTDPAAPAEEKQHVLLSCVHSGERSAVATLFAVMDWLLSDDPPAREVMRRQVVVCMPIIHPDGYVEGRLGPDQATRHWDLYSGWGMTGVQDPSAAPEAVALQRVIDRMRPDLYADVHGTSLDDPRTLMLESSATSPTNMMNRPYHLQIARMMDQAALDAGFPSDFQEDDRELLYWGSAVNSLEAKLWNGRDRWSAGLYAYGNYHTLHVLLEVTWQRSGLVRLQRLLRVGNERWDGELAPGYPNRIVGASHPAGMYQTIAAYGACAAQQRESRVEIWSKRHQLATGTTDPNMTGKTAAIFMLSTDAYRKWVEGNKKTSDFAANLKRHPDMNAEYIGGFLRGWPHGQNRPETYFSVWRGAQEGGIMQNDEPIRHGIALRIRIPYSQAIIREIRLNGHLVAESDEDGYSLWRARGFTFIQANMPPSKSQRESCWILTCEYDAGETRPHWEFWAGKRAGNGQGRVG